MRPLHNHPGSVVLLSAFLGWNPAVAGSMAVSGGPVLAVERTDRAAQTAAQAPPAVPAPAQNPSDIPAPGNPVVVMSTTLGEITLELFKDRAPVSVENFLQYVNDRFYEGTVFHRVRKGFMIQGGGFTADLTEKPTRAPIQNEATNGLRNARGTLAMARRAQLRSATSQFYINVVDNRMLDHTGFSPDEFGYAVFGRVLTGMDVVDRIVAVPTGAVRDMDDVPVQPVVITGVRVVK